MQVPVELVIVQPPTCVEAGQEDAFQEFVRGGSQEETSGQDHNLFDLVSVKVPQGWKRSALESFA